MRPAQEWLINRNNVHIAFYALHFHMPSDPITQTLDRPAKNLRMSDFRAIAQLAVQATEGVTRITEGCLLYTSDAADE